MADKQTNDFYVYDHIRPDTGNCFYVGKGRGSRAVRLKRNSYHSKIVSKLEGIGLSVEVRIVKDNMPEPCAFTLEKIRIAALRAKGVKLTNMTDGGDGTSGYVHTDHSRAKMSEKAINGLANMDKEKRDMMLKKRSASLKLVLGNMDEISKSSWVEKNSAANKAVHDTMTGERRAEISKNMSEGLRQAFSKRTASEINDFSEKVKVGLSRLSLDQKQARAKKVSETWEKKRQDNNAKCGIIS